MPYSLVDQQNFHKLLSGRNYAWLKTEVTSSILACAVCDRKSAICDTLFVCFESEFSINLSIFDTFYVITFDAIMALSHWR